MVSRVLVCSVMVFYLSAGICLPKVVVLQERRYIQDASMYSAPEARNKHYDGLTVSRGNVYYRAVIRFDLSNLPKKSIKDAAIMLFHTHQYHNSPLRLLVSTVNEPWDEKYVSWNRRTNAEKWGKNAFGKEVVAQFDISGNYGKGWIVLKSAKLTELINQWIMGESPNYGVVLYPAFKLAKGPSMKFFASKEGDDPSYYPKLILSYDEKISPEDFGYISDEELKRRKREFKNAYKVFREKLKRLYPKQKIVIWPVGPWDKLDKYQIPPNRSVKLSCKMLKNEYQVMSFAITNTQDKSIRLGVRLSGSEELGKTIVIRASYWIKAKPLSDIRGENFPIWVDDALPLLSENRYLSLKPGETRRVWLTVNSSHLTPKVYYGKLNIYSAQDKIYESIPITVSVLPIPLERDPELCVFTYAYLNRPSTKNYYEFAIRDLKSHYQNTYVIDYYPAPKIDDRGNIIDRGNFEGMSKWLTLISDAKKVLFYWCWDCGANRPLFDGKTNWLSESWRKVLKEWIEGWYSYLEGLGFDMDRVVMYPFDETYDNPILGRTEYQALGELAEELHKINPKIQLFIDPVSFSSKDLLEFQKLADKIDVWSVNVSLLVKGNHKGWPHSYTQQEKDKVLIFLKHLQKQGKLLWAYQCGGPMKALDINGYYRRFAWLCWYNGITGMGIWSYNNIRGPSSWNDFDANTGPDYTMIYELRDAPADIPRKPTEPLIPSKRWEAWRIAIQDYFLLQQIKHLSPMKEEVLKKIAKHVIDNGDDPVSYSSAREKLLKMLIDLQEKQK